MKLTTLLFFAAAFMVASVSSAPVKRKEFDPSLVPEFGIEPGQNPDSHGYCDGALDANGVPARIPPGCPPDRAAFVTVVQKHADPGWFGGTFFHGGSNKTVPFPTGNSNRDQQLRLSSSDNILTSYFKCPIESTTWARR
ncbi:hypothetical protein BC835DRAFT_1423786 [Cytidiella melzeri]|nr:hypothetical protein BC835DRAFT_1423786 [Cytidiella melzeri]